MSWKKILHDYVSSIELKKKKVKITCINATKGKEVLETLRNNISNLGTPTKLSKGLTAKDFTFEFSSDILAETFKTNMEKAIKSVVASSVAVSSPATTTILSRATTTAPSPTLALITKSASTVVNNAPLTGNLETEQPWQEVIKNNVTSVALTTQSAKNVYVVAKDAAAGQEAYKAISANTAVLEKYYTYVSGGTKGWAGVTYCFTDESTAQSFVTKLNTILGKVAPVTATSSQSGVIVPRTETVSTAPGGSAASTEQTPSEVFEVLPQAEIVHNDKKKTIIIAGIVVAVLVIGIIVLKKTKKK